MTLPVSLPEGDDDPTVQRVLEIITPVLAEIVRRAVDGTVPSIFTDYINQRVIIGASAISTANPGKIEITGDAKVLGSGNGLILPCRNGTSFARITLENPDSHGNIVISADPL